QYVRTYGQELGNFRDLLQEMSKDPAMMVWLDTAQSKKGMPNENYARELMELFSLGIGHYTEQDIREAARAFTGWELKAGQAHFNPAQHDPAEKDDLGQAGKWKGGSGRRHSPLRWKASARAFSIRRRSRAGTAAPPG